MKLTIKTLDRRSIVVDFDEQQTVGDLKKFLYDSKELTIEPEMQHLIYSGKQLNNEEVLSQCSIDEKRFLVVMAMRAKKPIETTNEDSSSSSDKKSNEAAKEKSSQKPKSSAKASTKGEKNDSSGPSRMRAGSSTTVQQQTGTASSTTTPPVSSENISQDRETMVQLLMEQMRPMGYSELDVRRAFQRANNDSDLAIEYLINGIPEPTPSSNPDFEVLRQHPRFQELRRELTCNPDMLEDVLTLLDATNPPLSSMIRTNQEEFMRLLNEAGPPVGVPLELSADDRRAVERLVAMGFEPANVVEAFLACDRNEEATADLLCHQMDEDEP